MESVLSTVPISGWLANRFGEKKVMVSSLSLSGLFLILYPSTKNYESVLVLTMLWGIVSEIFRPAAFSYLAEAVGAENRKAAYALVRVAINLGMSFGPAIGGLIAAYSFSVLYWVDGLTTLTAAVLIFFGLSSISREPETRIRESFIHSFLFAIRSGPLVTMILAFLPIMIVFFQNDSSVPLYITRDLNLKESTYGLMFTLNTTLIILFELPLNHATRHWPHHKSLSLGAFFVALGFGAMAYADSFDKIMGTVVLWTIGEMILFPSMNAYVSDISPTGRRGAFMALFNSGFNLCQVVSPTLGATLWQWYGAKQLWLISFIFGLTSVFLLYLFTNKQPSGVLQEAP